MLGKYIIKGVIQIDLKMKSKTLTLKDIFLRLFEKQILMRTRMLNSDQKDDQNTLKVTANDLVLHAKFMGDSLLNKAIPVCPCDVVILGVVVGGGPTKQNVYYQFFRYVSLHI